MEENSLEDQSISPQIETTTISPLATENETNLSLAETNETHNESSSDLAIVEEPNRPMLPPETTLSFEKAYIQAEPQFGESSTISATSPRVSKDANVEHPLSKPPDSNNTFSVSKTVEKTFGDIEGSRTKLAYGNVPKNVDGLKQLMVKSRKKRIFSLKLLYFFFFAEKWMLSRSNEISR